MTVSTPHVTLGHLGDDDVQRIPPTNQGGHMDELACPSLVLLSPNMVEFQHYPIILTTIDAWV